MRRLFLAALLVSSPALAGDEIDPETGLVVKYQDVTEVDGEELRVDGDMVKPEIKLLGDRMRASFKPLIKLRNDFAPEMAASVDEIK